jgi:hypothetical protein
MKEQHAHNWNCFFLETITISPITFGIEIFHFAKHMDWAKEYHGTKELGFQ